MDNCRSITLARALHKLWTTCIVTLATVYIEARNILSPEHEGFRADRSCSRAITHLSLCVEDAHSHMKVNDLCYLYFKDAFPSTDHHQLVRVLEFLGLPQDFTRLVSNLYSEASTEFDTPYSHPLPRGNMKGGPSRGSPISTIVRFYDRTPYPMVTRLTQGLHHRILWFKACQQVVRG